MVGIEHVVYDVDKDMKENRKTIKEVLARHMREEDDSESTTEWKEPKTMTSKAAMTLKSKNSMTKTYYKKKKNVFSRSSKTKKRLRKSDKEIFATE